MAKNFIVSSVRGTIVAYGFASPDELLSMLGIDPNGTLVIEPTPEQLAMCESSDAVLQVTKGDLPKPPTVRLNGG